MSFHQALAAGKSQPCGIVTAILRNATTFSLFGAGGVSSLLLGKLTGEGALPSWVCDSRFSIFSVHCDVSGSSLKPKF